MRAEASSNFYLPEGQSLTEEGNQFLQRLGWHAPTQPPCKDELPDGSANYHLHLDRPVPFAGLAALATTTLGEVFRVGHPQLLEYSAFARGKGPIRFPGLGIRRKGL